MPEKQLVILLKHSFYNTLIDKANVEGGIFLLLDSGGKWAGRAERLQNPPCRDFVRYFPLTKFMETEKPKYAEMLLT